MGKFKEIILLVLAVVLLIIVCILFAHPAKADTTMYVTTMLKEREEPTTNSPVVLIRTTGEYLQVRSITDDGWACLENGHYVSAQYLASDPSASMFKNRTMWIVVSAANVRVQPSKKAQILELRNFGEQVIVVDKQGEWFSVKGGGYIHQSCVYPNIENFMRDRYNDLILVSISKQYLTYFKNGEIITQGSIVTGKDTTPTPLGVNQIFYTESNTKMSGSDVDFAMYFVRGRGIAIHNAPWRKHFGGSRYHKKGSNGCVNTNYETAQLIYDNCRTNVTTVVVYQ